VTFFEATTAAAFLAFAETPADIVLLETGLGGRLDATNMVPDPVLTAITPISMDHTEFLGDTIAAIAGEKAGIIKEKVPCVVGPQMTAATEVIERVANNVGAPLFGYGSQWQADIARQGFYYKSAKREADFLLPNLVGAHQVPNAATAIACVDCLGDFTITPEHIAHGITHTVWPGRMQRLESGNLAQMLPSGSELWVDGGHNPGAGEILAQWAKIQTKPVHIICGMLKNKDIKQFLLPLAPYIKSLIPVIIDEQPQAMDPQMISTAAGALGIKNMAKKNVRNAIELIVKKEKNDFIILICGSLYLVGNILWQNGHEG
jgi:dihydrofolate synthase/folylpolyglutamate synthase